MKLTEELARNIITSENQGQDRDSAIKQMAEEMVESLDESYDNDLTDKEYELAKKMYENMLKSLADEADALKEDIINEDREEIEERIEGFRGEY